MSGKPQGALLEFKVSFSFFIIGLQAGEEVMLGGCNLLYHSVLYYGRLAVRRRRNVVKKWSCFKMRQLFTFKKKSLQSFSSNQ